MLMEEKDHLKDAVKKHLIKSSPKQFMMVNQEQNGIS